MPGRTLILALMCIWNRKAPCRTHFVRSMHLAFVALIQLFLYHISWDGKHIGSFLGPMFIQSRDPNIVQTKIPSDPLLTTRFAWTNHWLVWQDENIFAAHKTVTYLFITPGLPSVTLSPCCHLFFFLFAPPLCCTGEKHGPSLLSLLENAKSYQTVGSLTGTPQEALLKPRLNPTLLCPTLHTTTHSENSLISWLGCCTLTPQRHPDHSIGWYSNPGSVTLSQGERLFCFLPWTPRGVKEVPF